MLGRTKIIVWTMCYQFTSYQLKKSCELSSKQIWTLQIKENVVVRDSILKVDLKNQFRKLFSRSDSKVLSFENELVRKVIVTTSGKDSTRRITRHASLDYNVNEMKYCKQCYCDLLFMYLIEYLWIFVWYIYISLCVICKIIM
jgi:hypothetical protein